MKHHQCAELQTRLDMKLSVNHSLSRSTCMEIATYYSMPCPGYHQTHVFNSQEPIISPDACQRHPKQPACMPPFSRTRKAEDLWRVTKPFSLLVAVPGLYLNIMPPECTHHSLHGHTAGLDGVAAVSTNVSSGTSGTCSIILASRLSFLTSH